MSDSNTINIVAVGQVGTGKSTLLNYLVFPINGRDKNNN